MTVTDCPECGGETNHEWTIDEYDTHIKHVRTCVDCPTQYEVTYGNPVVREVEHFDT